jgi:hypothetical protein
MRITTRPSLAFWALSLTLILSGGLLLWPLALMLLLCFLPIATAWPWSWVISAIVPFLLISKMHSQAKGAHWSLDIDALESPSIGRILLVEIVGIHRGYPHAESLAMKALFDIISKRTARVTLNQTLILRLADNRLLPLNLISPSIQGGGVFMAKLAERLVGKQFPITDFSESEIKCLLSRPMNQLVSPLKSPVTQRTV